MMSFLISPVVVITLLARIACAMVADLEFPIVARLVLEPYIDVQAMTDLLRHHTNHVNRIKEFPNGSSFEWELPPIVNSGVLERVVLFVKCYLKFHISLFTKQSVKSVMAPLKYNPQETPFERAIKWIDSVRVNQLAKVDRMSLMLDFNQRGRALPLFELGLECAELLVEAIGLTCSYLCKTETDKRCLFEHMNRIYDAYWRLRFCKLSATISQVRLHTKRSKYYNTIPHVQQYGVDLEGVDIERNVLSFVKGTVRGLPANLLTFEMLDDFDVERWREFVRRGHEAIFQVLNADRVLDLLKHYEIQKNPLLLGCTSPTLFPLGLAYSPMSAIKDAQTAATFRLLFPHKPHHQLPATIYPTYWRDFGAAYCAVEMMPRQVPGFLWRAFLEVVAPRGCDWVAPSNYAIQMYGYLFELDWTLAAYHVACLEEIDKKRNPYSNSSIHSDNIQKIHMAAQNLLSMYKSGGTSARLFLHSTASHSLMSVKVSQMIREKADTHVSLYGYDDIKAPMETVKYFEWLMLRFTVIGPKFGMVSGVLEEQVQLSYRIYKMWSFGVDPEEAHKVDSIVLVR